MCLSSCWKSNQNTRLYSATSSESIHKVYLLCLLRNCLHFVYIYATISLLVDFCIWRLFSLLQKHPCSLLGSSAASLPASFQGTHFNELIVGIASEAVSWVYISSQLLLFPSLPDSYWPVALTNLFSCLLSANFIFWFLLIKSFHKKYFQLPSILGMVQKIWRNFPLFSPHTKPPGKSVDTSWTFMLLFLTLLPILFILSTQLVKVFWEMAVTYDCHYNA